MNYSEIVNVIRNISNAINPTGHFMHGRRSDGSLDYDQNFPQIHLMPIRTNFDVPAGIKNHDIILMFWQQDSPDSSNADREFKIDQMDALSDIFLDALYNDPANVSFNNVLKTPEYRQLAGTVSGYGISFTLTTVSLCSDTYITTEGGAGLDTEGGVPLVP